MYVCCWCRGLVVQYVAPGVIFTSYFFLYFRLLLSHVAYCAWWERHVRVLTYEHKLLYYRRCLLALLSFVWFALFAASVDEVVFGPSVFSVFPYYYVVCVFFLVHPVMPSEEGERDPVPFRCCVVGLPFFVPFVMCVLLVKYLQVDYEYYYYLLLLCWKSAVTVIEVTNHE